MKCTISPQKTHEQYQTYIVGVHVRGKGGYNGWMTLKLDQCVWVMYLHVCAKFRGSRVNSLGENPFGGGFPFWSLSLFDQIFI